MEETILVKLLCNLQDDFYNIKDIVNSKINKLHMIIDMPTKKLEEKYSEDFNKLNKENIHYEIDPLILKQYKLFQDLYKYLEILLKSFNNIKEDPSDENLKNYEKELLDIKSIIYFSAQSF